MIKKVSVLIDPKKEERRAHNAANGCRECGCHSNTLGGQIGATISAIKR